MKPFINDQHRISGTRVSVYDIYHWHINGHSRETIKEVQNIDDEQLQVALDYIDTNRDMVHKRHLEIEERNARGDSPEVRARIEAARPCLEAWKRSIRERMANREKSQHDSGGPGGSQPGGSPQSHIDPGLAHT